MARPRTVLTRQAQRELAAVSAWVVKRDAAIAGILTAARAASAAGAPWERIGEAAGFSGEHVRQMVMAMPPEAEPTEDPLSAT